MTGNPSVDVHGFRFAMIPEAMLYSDLPGTAIKVFGALMRHGSDPRRCYPSHKRIAKLCHVSVNTVRRSIDELVEAGWVTIVRRKGSTGGQASNGYRLHDSPQGGANIDTPLPTDEYPPLPTDEYPPYPPVSYEREQLNESNLNESPPASTARQEHTETRASEEGQETYGFKRLTEADHAAIAAAIAAGWKPKHIEAVAEQCRSNPEIRSPRAVWRHRLTNEDPPQSDTAEVTDVILAWTARGKPQGLLTGRAADLYSAHKPIRDACRNGTESDIRSAVRQAVAA